MEVPVKKRLLLQRLYSIPFNLAIPALWYRR